ncbi:MAG: tRNA (adenosine(37)-N6)-threonylcarbamoyltransferase complex ATPase subunit type 1 TsaE [Clostridia bacterium]|nr:tRNA (adenosine(37)-N6)-threonylcarbamoyltransferase complex ATPase subunit type 1 TsaE [Clostridia bacterium]
MQVYTHSYEETVQFAAEFSKSLKPGQIILLEGDLGAGKTSFVNGLLFALGFSTGGCSPTFTLVNEYPTNPPINHFDLYRISSEDELYEMGFSEYLESGRVNIIEWPQVAADILKDYPVTRLMIQHTDREDERIITIEEL